MPPNQEQLRPMLSVAAWLELPQDVRAQLVRLFTIPKSEGSHVVGNTVVSDGHTPMDLAHISIAKMQAFLKVETTDYYQLFEALVANLDDFSNDVSPAPAPIKNSPAEKPKSYVVIENLTTGDRVGIRDDKYVYKVGRANRMPAVAKTLPAKTKVHGKPKQTTGPAAKE